MYYILCILAIAVSQLLLRKYHIPSSITVSYCVQYNSKGCISVYYKTVFINPQVLRVTVAVWSKFVFTLAAQYGLCTLKMWCHYASLGKLYKWNVYRLFFHHRIQKLRRFLTIFAVRPILFVCG